MTSIFTNDPSDPMSSLLAQNWWAVALRGAVAILIGICALVFPGQVILSMVLLFAIYMLVDAILGATAAVRAARQHERWGLLLAGAVLNVLAAAVAMLAPGLTILAFVLLIAAWCVVTGALGLVSAFRLRGDHGRWWMALGSVASIVFGVLLAIAPLIGAVVLTWWIGAFALVFGVSLLVLAYRLRPHRADHLHPGGAALHGA